MVRTVIFSGNVCIRYKSVTQNQIGVRCQLNKRVESKKEFPSNVKWNEENLAQGERRKVLPARENYVNWIYWDRKIQNQKISTDFNLNIIIIQNYTYRISITGRDLNYIFSIEVIFLLYGKVEFSSRVSGQGTFQ